MAPKLYMIYASPPVRSVLMTAKAIEIELEVIEIDMAKGDHLTPKYLELNPQHTVPTLDDNGTIICDSHAINSYLVGKYGKDDLLYPKDLVQRACVDQRLYFDTSFFAYFARGVIKPIIFEGVKTIPENQIEIATEYYGIMEKFLEKSLWVAGYHITIADFSLIPSLTSLCVLIPLDEKKFPKVAAWIARSQALPYYEPNAVGLESFKTFINNLLAV